MADYRGRTYEYATKSELQLLRENIEVIITELQDRLGTRKVTISFHLVGSAGRHLVTKVVGGNTGFDFDYNFSIQKDANLKPKELKNVFINELNQVLKNTQYKSVENNTQSMTIKVVDVDNKRIVHACDFAIVNDYIDDDGNTHQEILIYDKTTENYTWNKRPNSKNIGIKVSNLVANGLWVEVKEEYLKIKNNNQDKNKKSFSLYFEAVNNVYTRYNWV